MREPTNDHKSALVTLQNLQNRRRALLGRPSRAVHKKILKQFGPQLRKELMDVTIVLSQLFKTCASESYFWGNFETTLEAAKEMLEAKLERFERRNMLIKEILRPLPIDTVKRINAFMDRPQLRRDLHVLRCCNERLPQIQKFEEVFGAVAFFAMAFNRNCD